MLLSQQSPEEIEKNYIVLARRTRPQSLGDLVGQDSVANSMTNMLTSKKIPHAFLFTGTRGTGKTSSARILAKSLCCEKGPTPFPCQTCVHCKQITACAHDDILEIDGASNTGVDNVRELNESARFYPHSAKYKIFIIDEVHMLSTGAFNALLKTLEEPPRQVVFILATTELHKVPITVRSRCMIFSFKKIETSLISGHLKNILTKENITFEEDAVQIISREAKGSIRDSLSLLEQAIAICGGKHLSESETKKGLCVQGEELAERLFASICQKELENAYEILNEANIQSLDVATLIENTAALFRSAALVKNLGLTERTLRLTQLIEKEAQFLEQTSKKLSYLALSEIFKTGSQSVREISRSTASFAWAEVILTDCILKSDWMSSSEIFSLLNNEKFSNVTSPSIAQVNSNNATTNTPLQLNQPRINKEANTPAPQISNEKQNTELNLFKQFVENTRKKSEVLATKLKFVKVNVFNKTEIEFENSKENETYLSFNEQDTVIFWECLKEMGLENTPIKSPVLKLKTIKKSPENIPVKTKEPINFAAKIQSHKETTENIFKNFQKFSQSPSNPPSFVKTTSLNEIAKEEKSKAHLEKSKEILSKESIQQLNKLATEIKIIDL